MNMTIAAEKRVAMRELLRRLSEDNEEGGEMPNE